MNPIITLTTDFGLEDSYVGEMKAVLLSGAPSAQIVDICHAVRAYDIEWGAFQLLRSYRYFPEQTFHVVVIDPGVGTSRKAVYAKTGRYHFVGPDNGVLLWAVKDAEEKEGVQAEIYEIPPRKNLPETFHGRDLFAPFVVDLIGNKEINMRKLNNLVGNEFPGSRELNGVCRGEVIGRDRFGNVITSVEVTDSLRAEAQVGERPEKYTSVKNYHGIEEDQIALIRGSHGFWEFAARKASAWDALRAKAGDEVTVYPLD